MRYSFFSDLHIKSPGDEACRLIQKLFQNETFLTSDHIVFLGDIFDALAGEHQQYIKKYSFFFETVIQLLNQNKKVTYFEGNHDFHFQKTFEKYVNQFSKNPELFSYRKEGIIEEINGQKYYFCHGDEVDFYNQYFKRWKRIYTSSLFAFTLNYIFPYRFIEFLGERASKNSKKRGSKSFDYESNREKYLVGAKALLSMKQVDGVICGHTHIQEHHQYDNGSIYLNTGFPLKQKNFLTIDQQIEFINL